MLPLGCLNVVSIPRREGTAAFAFDRRARMVSLAQVGGAGHACPRFSRYGGDVPGRSCYRDREWEKSGSWAFLILPAPDC